MGERGVWAVAGGCVVVVAIVVAVFVRRDPVDRVVLVGDSIAEEAAPYLEQDIDGIDVVEHAYRATAPCDWSLDEVAAGDGDLVVLSFTGNSATPCMSDGAGGHLHGDALVAKYEDDLGALVEGIGTRGAEVLLVGQPERGPNADGIEEVRGINAIYETLAEEDGVSFVDAGAAVETDDGAFTAKLPCVPGERECGPSGRNTVRNPDGLHLCPQTVPGQCPVYSSGAFRFAGAIADAIESR
jgi:hypothetical protein